MHTYLIANCWQKCLQIKSDLVLCKMQQVAKKMIVNLFGELVEEKVPGLKTCLKDAIILLQWRVHEI